MTYPSSLTELPVGQNVVKSDAIESKSSRVKSHDKSGNSKVVSEGSSVHFTVRDEVVDEGIQYMPHLTPFDAKSSKRSRSTDSIRTRMPPEKAPRLSPTTLSSNIQRSHLMPLAVNIASSVPVMKTPSKGSGARQQSPSVNDPPAAMRPPESQQSRATASRAVPPRPPPPRATGSRAGSSREEEVEEGQGRPRRAAAVKSDQARKELLRKGQI